MKQLLYFVFGLLLLAGCSKDKTDDPTPKTPAEAIAGLYPMTAITSSGTTVNLPFSGNGVNISGTVNVVAVAGKQDETTMTITLKVTGSPDATSSGPVQVKTTSKGYDLFDNGQKLGTVESNTLTITDGSDVIVAKK